MNGNETKEKDYLLEPSVDRWMVNLLKQARLVDHDVGVSSRGDNKETNCQQFPIDEALYQKGRIFYQRNFFVVIVSMLAGLYSIIFLPSIAAVLKITGKSDTKVLAFQRYLRTVIHTSSWFEDCETMQKSLRLVLQMHRAASNKSVRAGSITTEHHLSVHYDDTSATNDSDVGKRRGITQLDMVVTQWGFVGPILLFQDNLFRDLDEKDCEAGFVYILYLVGRLLGIEDRFNLCSGSLEETRARCLAVLRQIIQPEMSRRDHTSVSLSTSLLGGINILNPFLNQQVHRLLFERLIFEEKLDLPSDHRRGLSTLLFLYKVVLTLPGRRVIRATFNGLLRLNIWLANDWLDYIVKENQEERTFTLLDRIKRFILIPVFTIISCAREMCNKFRSNRDQVEFAN